MRPPPVVLIHGACSRPAHFAAWRAMFADAGHPCVVPALPGRDPVDRALLRRTGFGDCLEAVRTALRGIGERPVLVGHSLGALVARMLATEGLARALVLVAPMPGGRIPVTAAALPCCLAVAPMVLAGLPFAPWRMAARELALHHLPRAEQDAVAAGMVPESGRAYRDLLFGRATVARKAIRCPVLVLHGDGDRLIPPAVARGIAAKHGGTLTVIPGHGHWLIAPSLVATAGAAAREWIVGLPAAGRASRQLR